ncbi:transcription factor JunD-like [Dendrobates tinctorius]|uniref:transcription factor JunD-like n=1 Tax=Dendrobates tinctorius TaxID=92724 RepID=UPI003CC93753
MEMPFYHEDLLNVYRDSFPHSPIASKMMKKDMNLSNSDEMLSYEKPHHLEGNELINLIDMGLMNLPSLDLERRIQPNGVGAAHSTSSHCLYPKMPDMEQGFSDGFVLPLGEPHKQTQLNNSMKMSSVSTGDPVHPPEPSHTSVYVNFNNYGNEAVSTTTSYNTDHVFYPNLPTTMEELSAYPTQRLHAVKDELQIVPEMTSFGDSPPLSPINMDNQERIKAERKKLRNRIAATKCRKRKLERISRLEDKVKNLKMQNTDLASTASILKEQVADLKQKVMSHVNSGCQLVPYHAQAY